MTQIYLLMRMWASNVEFTYEDTQALRYEAVPNDFNRNNREGHSHGIYTADEPIVRSAPGSPIFPAPVLHHHMFNFLFHSSAHQSFSEKGVKKNWMYVKCAACYY